MEFDKVYENATLLNDDWLRNECAYELSDLSPAQRNALYRQYYLNMCAAINSLLYLKPSSAQIEELLANPSYNIGQSCRCSNSGLFTNVTDANERKYLFLMLQYDQIVFDIANGRTAMLRGEDKKWIIAPDALAKLDMLGFCQKTFAMKW